MFKKLKWAIVFCVVNTMSYAQTTHTPPSIYTEAKPAVMATKNQSQFVIQLKSNPTTGYAWFLRDYNGDLIQPVKHEFKPAEDKKLMGAPGYELWTFKVKAAGFVVPQQTTVRFVYTRPWEVVDSTTQLIFKVTTSPS